MYPRVPGGAPLGDDLWIDLEGSAWGKSPLNLFGRHPDASVQNADPVFRKVHRNVYLVRAFQPKDGRIFDRIDGVLYRLYKRIVGTIVAFENAADLAPAIIVS